MSDTTKPHDDDPSRRAAARRRLQVLQAFVKGRRAPPPTAIDGAGKHAGEKEMRWSPFVAFNRKVVALQEMSASSSEEDNDKQQVDHLSKDTKCVKWKKSEIFEEATYSLVGDLSKNEMEVEDGSKSSQVISALARRLIISPCGEQHRPLVSLLERREAAGTSVGDVKASVRDGIDNTGNFHWPTEDITAAYFLNKAARDATQTQLGDTTVLCEIGAGCGLASFALAKALAALKAPPHLILATDGNSRVVHALKRNVKRVTCALNEDASTSGGNNPINNVTVTSGMLPWQCQTSLENVFATIDTWLLDSSVPIDNRRTNSSDITLFGSDCLFFERFHHDLARLVLKWMYHYRRDNSVVRVLLFAPSRGGSLERFIDILHEEIRQKKARDDESSSSIIPQLSIDVALDYDEHITRVWKQVVVEEDPQFNPDRHLPKLVSITTATTTTPEGRV